MGTLNDIVTNAMSNNSQYYSNSQNALNKTNQDMQTRVMRQQPQQQSKGLTGNASGGLFSSATNSAIGKGLKNAFSSSSNSAGVSPNAGSNSTLGSADTGAGLGGGTSAAVDMGGDFSDANFQEPGGPAKATLREVPFGSGLVLKNQLTGQLGEVMTRPLSKEETLRANHHGAGSLRADDPNRQSTQMSDMDVAGSSGYSNGVGPQGLTAQQYASGVPKQQENQMIQNTFAQNPMQKMDAFADMDMMGGGRAMGGIPSPPVPWVRNGPPMNQRPMADGDIGMDDPGYAALYGGGGDGQAQQMGDMGPAPPLQADYQEPVPQVYAHYDATGQPIQAATPATSTYGSFGDGKHFYRSGTDYNIPEMHEAETKKDANGNPVNLTYASQNLGANEWNNGFATPPLPVSDEEVIRRRQAAGLVVDKSAGAPNYYPSMEEYGYGEPHVQTAEPVKRAAPAPVEVHVHLHNHDEVNKDHDDKEEDDKKQQYLKAGNYADADLGKRIMSHKINAMGHSIKRGMSQRLQGKK